MADDAGRETLALYLELQNREAFVRGTEEAASATEHLERAIRASQAGMDFQAESARGATIELRGLGQASDRAASGNATAQVVALETNLQMRDVSIANVQLASTARIAASAIAAEAAAASQLARAIPAATGRDVLGPTAGHAQELARHLGRGAVEAQRVEVAVERAGRAADKAGRIAREVRIHEAGHAVMALQQGFDPRITYRPGGQSGTTSFELPEVTSAAEWRARAVAMALTAYGGPAAHAIYARGGLKGGPVEPADLEQYMSPADRRMAGSTAFLRDPAMQDLLRRRAITEATRRYEEIQRIADLDLVPARGERGRRGDVSPVSFDFPTRPPDFESESGAENIHRALIRRTEAQGRGLGRTALPHGPGQVNAGTPNQMAAAVVQRQLDLDALSRPPGTRTRIPQSLTEQLRVYEAWRAGASDRPKPSELLARGVSVLSAGSTNEASRGAITKIDEVSKAIAALQAGRGSREFHQAARWLPLTEHPGFNLEYKKRRPIPLSRLLEGSVLEEFQQAQKEIEDSLVVEHGLPRGGSRVAGGLREYRRRSRSAWIAKARATSLQADPERARREPKWQGDLAQGRDEFTTPHHRVRIAVPDTAVREAMSREAQQNARQISGQAGRSHISRARADFDALGTTFLATAARGEALHGTLEGVDESLGDMVVRLTKIHGPEPVLATLLTAEASQATQANLARANYESLPDKARTSPLSTKYHAAARSQAIVEERARALRTQAEAALRPAIEASRDQRALIDAEEAKAREIAEAKAAGRQPPGGLPPGQRTTAGGGRRGRGGGGGGGRRYGGASLLPDSSGAEEQQIGYNEMADAAQVGRWQALALARIEAAHALGNEERMVFAYKDALGVLEPRQIAALAQQQAMDDARRKSLGALANTLDEDAKLYATTVLLTSAEKGSMATTQEAVAAKIQAATAAALYTEATQGEAAAAAELTEVSEALGWAQGILTPQQLQAAGAAAGAATEMRLQTEAAEALEKANWDNLIVQAQGTAATEVAEATLRQGATAAIVAATAEGRHTEALQAATAARDVLNLSETQAAFTAGQAAAAKLKLADAERVLAAAAARRRVVAGEGSQLVGEGLAAGANEARLKEAQRRISELTAAGDLTGAGRVAGRSGLTDEQVKEAAAAGQAAQVEAGYLVARERTARANAVTAGSEQTVMMARKAQTLAAIEAAAREGDLAKARQLAWAGNLPIAAAEVQQATHRGTQARIEKANWDNLVAQAQGTVATEAAEASLKQVALASIVAATAEGRHTDAMRAATVARDDLTLAETRAAFAAGHAAAAKKSLAAAEEAVALAAARRRMVAGEEGALVSEGVARGSETARTAEARTQIKERVAGGDARGAARAAGRARGFLTDEQVASAAAEGRAAQVAANYALARARATQADAVAAGVAAGATASRKASTLAAIEAAVREGDLAKARQLAFAATVPLTAAEARQAAERGAEARATAQQVAWQNQLTQADRRRWATMTLALATRRATKQATEGQALAELKEALASGNLRRQKAALISAQRVLSREQIEGAIATDLQTAAYRRQQRVLLVMKAIKANIVKTLIAIALAAASAVASVASAAVSVTLLARSSVGLLAGQLSLMKLAAMAREYQLELKRVEVQTRASAGAMEEFRSFTMGRDFENLGINSTEVARGVKAITSESYSLADSQHIYRASAVLATAAEMEQVDATQLLLAVMRQYGYEATQAMAVADQVVEVLSSTAVTSQQVASVMGYAGEAAASLGWSLSETLATIDPLIGTLRKPEMAGRYLRTMLTSLVSPSGETAQAFLEAGLDISEFGEHAGSATTLIAWLEEGLWTAERIVRAFGTQGGVAARILLSQSVPALEAKTKAIETMGSAEARAAEISKTLDGRQKAFAAQLQNTKNRLGELAMHAYPAVYAAMGVVLEYIEAYIAGQQRQGLAQDTVAASAGRLASAIVSTAATMARALLTVLGITTKLGLALLWTADMFRGFGYIGRSEDDPIRQAAEQYRDMQRQAEALRAQGHESQARAIETSLKAWRTEIPWRGGDLEREPSLQNRAGREEAASLAGRMANTEYIRNAQADLRAADQGIKDIRAQVDTLEANAQGFIDRVVATASQTTAETAEQVRNAVEPLGKADVTLPVGSYTAGPEALERQNRERTAEQELLIERALLEAEQRHDPRAEIQGLEAAVELRKEQVEYAKKYYRAAQEHNRTLPDRLLKEAAGGEQLAEGDKSLVDVEAARQNILKAENEHLRAQIDLDKQRVELATRQTEAWYDGRMALAQYNGDLAAQGQILLEQANYQAGMVRYWESVGDTEQWSRSMQDLRKTQEAYFKLGDDDRKKAAKDYDDLMKRSSETQKTIQMVLGGTLREGVQEAIERVGRAQGKIKGLLTTASVVRTGNRKLEIELVNKEGEVSPALLDRIIDKLVPALKEATKEGIAA